MTKTYILVCVGFQSAVLDLYIKSVLMSKTKPQQYILDKSGSLLRHVSHSDFKELLLPTVQKTMLRSPENAMQSKTLMIMFSTYLLNAQLWHSGLKHCLLSLQPFRACCPV